MFLQMIKAFWLGNSQILYCDFSGCKAIPCAANLRPHTIALNTDCELPLGLVGYPCSLGTDHKQLSACLVQSTPSSTEKTPTESLALGNKVLVNNEFPNRLFLFLSEMWTYEKHMRQTVLFPSFTSVRAFVVLSKCIRLIFSEGHLWNSGHQCVVVLTNGLLSGCSIC